MTTLSSDLVLSSALSDRRLLEHPFYRRWELGEVTAAELAAYAGQYRHFERYLPVFLTKLVSELPAGKARDLVAANLADEEGDPVPHVELFERFASAVGAKDDAPSPATVALLDTYDELLEQGADAALAGFVAYECQASEVARRKADGLRSDYGLDEWGVSFWEHHVDVDDRHGAWAKAALSESAEDPSELTDAARRAADAWWAFLDERELACRAG